MKSKTSFFNKGIILDDIRRFGWISIAYTLVLFFLVPLQILMLHSSKQIYEWQITEIIINKFYFSNTSEGFFVIIVPTLLAIFLFRYIHVKIAADMIHSLPIKRSTLYRSHILVGIISLILPVIIIAIVSIFLNKTLALGQYYHIYDVAQWTGITILFELFFFFAAVFAGMLVGSSVMQGGLTFALVLLPIGLIGLLTENLRVFLYGFMFRPSYNIDKISPVIRILQGFRYYDNGFKEITVTEVIVYVLLCIILYFGGNFLYNKRKLEAATQTFAFKSLQYVFKYSVTFFSMLIGGIYFQQTDKNIYWICFGFFTASAIGYFVAEMIIKKSIWVFKNAKGYAIYVVVIIIIMLGVKFDVIGYENKLPSLDKVDNVYFVENLYNFNYENYKDTEIPSKIYLQSVYDFHKKLVEDKEKNRYSHDEKIRNVTLMYKLKNGSKVIRNYNISTKAYIDYLKPIHETKEYKRIKYPIFHIDTSDVKKIQIRAFDGNKKEIQITNSSDIKEAIEILKQDIDNESVEDTFDEKEIRSDVNLDLEHNSMAKYRNWPETYISERDVNTHLLWKKSYKLFEGWLEKKGYLEKMN